MNGEILL